MSIVNLTESAKDYLKSVGKPNVSLSINSGGCSGFKYDFSFDNKVDENDLKHNNIVIDKSSLEMLKGSNIDFTEELIGSSFKINNPKSPWLFYLIRSGHQK